MAMVDDGMGNREIRSFDGERTMKETIEYLKHLLSCQDPENQLEITHLQSAISDLELMDKVRGFMPEKIKEEIKNILVESFKPGGNSWDYAIDKILDLCTAYFAGKLGEIEEVIKQFILFEFQDGKFVYPVEFQDFIKDKPDFFNALSQAIIEHLIGERI